jgi:hypothetical protein
MIESHIFRFLDTNGDGTGTTLATGDYSVTAVEFFIQPPTAETFHIHRMIVNIEDTAITDGAGYGGTGALTTGITVHVEDGGVTIDELTDGEPIKSNAHWGRFCYDVTAPAFGASNKTVQVRWTFAKSGKPITLYGNNVDGQASGDNHRLVVTCNDDFSALVDHRFMVQGVRGT